MFFAVHAINVETGKEELLFQQDGNNDFAASKDASKIIFSRDGTELGLGNNFYLIDTKTKEATPLIAHEDTLQFAEVIFNSNNEINFLPNDKRGFITPR